MLKETMKYDLIFISYDEPEAEQNWERVKSIYPNTKRVHKVNGIAKAWKKAAEISETSHFFTMDGDSQLLDNFNFDIENFQGEVDKRVHVYRCRNRVNGLVYGYGSVHLFNTQLVRDFQDLDVVDFTLSVATEDFYIQPEIASITCFNTSPYISWKSGFRESSKLASRTNAYAGTQPDHRTMSRLKVWTSIGRDSLFGEYVLLGARMGSIHGFKFKDCPDELSKISNHDWFRDGFERIKKHSIEEQLSNASKELLDFGFTCPEYSCKQSLHIKELLYNV